jgi:hypothetical protein
MNDDVHEELVVLQETHLCSKKRSSREFSHLRSSSSAVGMEWNGMEWNGMEWTLLLFRQQQDSRLHRGLWQGNGSREKQLKLNTR